MGKKIIDDLKQEDSVKENIILNISSKIGSSGAGGYGLNII